ncbi:MAG: carboxypeptidase regulatory-like domain-containing protein, partial [Deltaproteobacteria bacterium]|nr:carboxypeptidase regulatory-like domain-containing protein [Deltaproteobacteria bacterium]
GRVPVGEVTVELEQEVDGEWRATRREPVHTPSGIAYFPNLGLVADPIGASDQHYRVRVRWSMGSPLYEGGYPSGQAGALFTIEAWNQYHRPQSKPTAQNVFLLPGPTYPFPPEVWVLRGRVIDGAGEPVADALVEQGAQERVLSDARGEFALPLRWVSEGPLAIDFRDHLGRTAIHNISVPDDLGAGHEIIVA